MLGDAGRIAPQSSRAIFPGCHGNQAEVKYLFLFLFVVHMACSDADPITESLLSVPSQVEISLQTCQLLNGKVKHHRDSAQD